MWDYVHFHESAARNGLAGVAVPAGEDIYKYSGDDLYVRAAGTVVMAGVISAAIANFDEARFRRKRDPNFNHLRTFVRDQTGAIVPPAFLAYDFYDGDVLQADADNGNNAQIESVFLALAYDQSPLLSFSQPKTQIPSGAKWVNGVGATTVTANTWSLASMTWSETFDITKMYQILGMNAYSATGYGARLRFKGSSPWRGYSPGVPCGDTNILNAVIYGDFGQFRGDQPPDLQMLCSAGDTAQYSDMLIVEL